MSRRGVVHRCPDHPERDRVDTDTPGGVFDRQRSGHGNQAALGQGGQRRGPRAVGVVDEAGADFDDVPAPWVSIARMARWVMWKNPARFTAVIAAKSWVA
jgi:hypothetical protein